jgi:hypothetical protein
VVNGRVPGGAHDLDPEQQAQRFVNELDRQAAPSTC